MFLCSYAFFWRWQSLLLGLACISILVLRPALLNWPLCKTEKKKKGCNFVPLVQCCLSPPSLWVCSPRTCAAVTWGRVLVSACAISALFATHFIIISQSVGFLFFSFFWRMVVSGLWTSKCKMWQPECLCAYLEHECVMFCDCVNLWEQLEAVCMMQPAVVETLKCCCIWCFNLCLNKNCDD